MNNNNFFDSVFNLKTALAFGIAVIMSAVSYSAFGSKAGMVFGGLIFIFTVLYSVLFSGKEKIKKREVSYNDLRKLAYEARDRLTPILEKLVTVLNSIKAFNGSKYLFISEFMTEVANFEEIIPNLVMSYRKGARFLANRDAQASTDIKSIEMKLNSSVSESVRQTYEKALQEKRQTLEELQHMRNNLEECESKLYYILSTLEKIETIIYSDELNDNMTDETSRNINQQLEIFSGSVKDIAKVMKL
ncbi:MAG: hypothetical protein Q8942_07235 [Bacillota bacterium]|nr:hypothetical protein [Bacillota bacterium]